MATTKADLSEFLALGTPKRKPCQVAVALGKLDGQDKVNATHAIAQQRTLISGGVIERWFKEHGLTVSANSVHAHRVNRCSCPDE